MTQSTTQSTIVNFWHRLIRPHPSITDLEQRRQSRLLALFTGLLVIALIPVIVWTAVDPLRPPEVRQRLIPSLVVLGLAVAGLYFLNRVGKYRLSAYGLIAISFG